MYVLIDGYYACGKSVLLGLLNGSDGLFLSPVQDDIINGFSRYPNIDEMLKHRDMIAFRKLLVNYTNFYILEHYASIGRLNFDVSPDIATYHSFKYNFLAYEHDVLNSVSSLEIWSEKNLIDIIFTKMPWYWENLNTSKNDIKKFVTWGMHYTDGAHFVLNKIPDGKVISLRRDPIDVFATRLNRKPKADNFRSSYRAKMDFWKYLDAEVLNDVRERNHHIDVLRSEYPDRIFVMEFNELIINTEQTMRSLADFLNIPFSQNLMAYTVNGELPDEHFQKMALGNINDSKELLLESEISVLEVELGLKPALSLFKHPNTLQQWLNKRYLRKKAGIAKRNLMKCLR